MSTRDDNPRWLAALATAVPVLLGVLAAWAAGAPRVHRPDGPPPRPVVSASAEPVRVARIP